MKKTEIVIIGGGLAGLTASIHLSISGFKVVLLEKNQYPQHKVCGEYLSKEILNYLNSLEIDLLKLNPAYINNLVYSTSKGKITASPLSMGGIGISRYALDNFLYKKAIQFGVEVIQETAVEINFTDKRFIVVLSNGQKLCAPIVLGAYGKRSNLDKTLNRKFIKNKSGWLAFKGHYKMDEYPSDSVSLHNFKGGYCGLSKIENNNVNVCYLATYKSFKKYKDPVSFKEKVLRQNPHLDQFFESATPIFPKDISIAQISFDKKSLVHDHILMLGDAAALIYPLSGNGMAMAIHSAKMASENIIKYYKGDKNFNRKKLEASYVKNWNKNFRSRIYSGRILQKILLNANLSAISQRVIYYLPFLLPKIISKTHGKTVI